MKKHGFTLIELLAVITILGILIIMIVPKVTDTLSKAEDDAYQRQINSIIDIAKKWGASNNDKLPEETICIAVTELSTQKYYDYNYSTGNGESKEEKTGVLASVAGPYAYGVEYTCYLGDEEEKTFYVLENNEDTVSLIMNKNIDSDGLGVTSGSLVTWSSDGSNHKVEEESKQAVTAKTYLKSYTNNWVRLNSKQISLPTGEQIALVGGDTEWTSETYTKNVLTSPWLYENLYVDNSAPYGYWVSTPYMSSSNHAWLLHYIGILYHNNVDNNEYYGIRPVITIPKKQLNDGLENKDYGVLYLSLDTLVADGYIKENKIINPKTDEKLEGCIKINYDNIYSQYVYNYVENNNICK